MTLDNLSNSEAFRHDINALRALAVMAVILYHFEALGVASGYLGVDVFFVISGFLIGGHVSTQIESGRFRFSAFMTSRIRRIVPALIAMSTAILLWGWLYLLPTDFKLLARSVLSAVTFESNILFANQLGYFDLAS